MSVVKRLCAVGPALFLSLWCGKTDSIALCRVLPDTAALESHCSFNIATATFADVVTAFHLAPTLDSKHQSLVALQNAAVQLSFGSEFLTAEDAAEPIRATARVRSVLMRRYFATPKAATEFLAGLRRRIESAFICTKDAQDSDWPGTLCRDPQHVGTEIRYLWTNWADDPNAKAPFEITISVRLL